MARPAFPMPSDFPDVSASMPVMEVADHYGVGRDTVLRWRAECDMRRSYTKVTPGGYERLPSESDLVTGAQLGSEALHRATVAMCIRNRLTLWGKSGAETYAAARKLGMVR